MSFRVVGTCPVNTMLAPYIALLVRDCGAHVNSLYRGDPAASILHARGHQTQSEVYRSSPPGVANPPGRSTHELRSDAVAYPGPVGRHLDWWCNGIDVNDRDVRPMIEAARRRGWHLVQSYHSGAEVHHLNFSRRPRPKGPLTAAKLIRLRATLPRR